MEEVYKLGRGQWKTIEQGNELLWMIGNGIGGYANQTVSGGGAMSFNGYLIASLNPPVSRYLVFTRTQEELLIGKRKYDLTSQQYINFSKNGQQYLQRFLFDSVPEYSYKVEDVSIKKSIAMEYGHNTVVVCYEVDNGSEDIKLNIVPLFNYRAAGETTEKAQLDFMVTKHDNYLNLIPKENNQMSIDFQISEGSFYDRNQIPVSMATPNYLIEENHYYMIDNRTGYLGLDNHYTPYEVHIDVKAFEHKKFYVKCTTEGLNNRDGFEILNEYRERADRLVRNAGYDNGFINNLVKAADHFIVKRNSTELKTILAGFPWFTDWGRDTMIAFEGLLLVTKRFEDAKEILESFAKYIKNGLVPNLFPDENTEPGYNTVDASLWYFQAVYKYLMYTRTEEAYSFIKEKIYPKLIEIFKAYSTKTDFSIGMDEDGLIYAGGGLDQVTWMDVRVGDYVVTPRHGKPVEINALWYNALCIMEELSFKFGESTDTYSKLKQQVKVSFNDKFWNEEKHCLYDVVDDNDSSIRPNQIWAVSLPFSVLEREKEKSVVEIVYKHLYSTYGLRSLSFMDERFKPKYIGKLLNRDCAYHMGTTWGFLIGPFITAYCKVNDDSKEALEKAKEMCEVFEDHMKDGCINGIAEIFDGEFSSTSRGCYTQAWSVGEVLRAYAYVIEKY
ncbi:amylo-alpha-1,6-glucosidase [Inconstantimicrobium mannanitabidum]|uniref:Glycogen debranching protein n=1 Tax=Inconstantimicrobium mannanitabidum TaxID=1604901 RepID=A0ACB5REM9_9CLOT|nr:amylo-alpha-1,6-glucosidase [Clostridium sp. TW13]GKX67247.1 glycogen debranching protein [Clostridium sp. TW13]